MASVTFILADGSEKTLDVADGTSIMEAGRDNNLGLEGTCGGSLSCATCHVILDADSFARVGAPSEDEMDMLDLAFGVSDTSRLGCQIKMSDALDGIRVQVPDDM